MKNSDVLFLNGESGQNSVLQSTDSIIINYLILNKKYIRQYLYKCLSCSFYYSVLHRKCVLQMANFTDAYKRLKNFISMIWTLLKIDKRSTYKGRTIFFIHLLLLRFQHKICHYFKPSLCLAELLRNKKTAIKDARQDIGFYGRLNPPRNCCLNTWISDICRALLLMACIISGGELWHELRLFLCEVTFSLPSFSI